MIEILQSNHPDELNTIAPDKASIIRNPFSFIIIRFLT